MPGRRANNIEKYEKQARKIWDQYEKTWDERREEVERLLTEFCAQA